MLRKVLRRVFDKVTFDQLSFDRAVEAAGRDGRLVLVSTHRSYMDFLVCPYLFFSRPDLRIRMPYQAVAQEFADVPVLGWLLDKLHVFYLKRGVGQEDPALTRQVHRLVNQGKTLHFFIEGQRSRSRQFLAPRRGLLRALQSSGKRFVILPVAISYDRIPEESALLSELKGYPEKKRPLSALLQWTAAMLRGEVQLGHVHIRCGEALILDQQSNVPEFARLVMAQLQGHTVTTTYHLQCFTQLHTQAGVDVAWLREAIVRRGGAVVDSPMTKKGAQMIDPLLERCFRHHWLHLFFREACSAQPGNPALRHYVEENGYAESRMADPFTLSDLRVQSLLFQLFAPICADYSAVADAVRRFASDAGMISAKAILQRTAYQDLATATAGIRALVQAGFLEAAADRRRDEYRVTASASELAAYIALCQWKLPDALNANAGALAVGS